MKLRTSVLTKPGGREKNEDYAAYSGRRGYYCFLVADGLGGHRGGELASRTACESVLEAFNKRPGGSVDHLHGYLKHAGRAMSALRSKTGLADSLKTTLVILLIDKKSATWAHIGDSRLYYFNSGRLAFQTKDHSLPQRLVDIGEIRFDQIRFHEDRNRLISVFEGEEVSRFTLLKAPIPINEGDAFLLCSDGFWDYVYEAEMESNLQRSRTPAGWISHLEDKLLERAEGNYDNYTALAVIAR